MFAAVVDEPSLYIKGGYKIIILFMSKFILALVVHRPAHGSTSLTGTCIRSTDRLPVQQVQYIDESIKDWAQFESVNKQIIELAI